jgi:hypothetical protein
MPSESPAPGGRVAAAAPRTVAAGTARLFAAWSTGAPVPAAADRRCDGVTDLAARRARVWQVPFFTDGTAAEISARLDDDEALRALSEPQEMIYDGANVYLRVAGRWTGFFLGDPGGPRGVNDPLWPLDVLFGADDAVETGSDPVRGMAVTRYRLSLDLARADAAVPAGVSVPAGPYRALRQMPAEVWLDEAGLARRIAVATDPAAVVNEQIWAVVELWDFGLAVDITPPRADEIVTPGEAFRETQNSPS